MKGYISEIFSSLQGEGVWVGERQIFVRLAGCPWRCVYCDTPDSLTKRGSRAAEVEDVLDDVHHLQEKQEHRTVSVTGGEPLSQGDFLRELLPALKRLDLRVHLETSGTQPAAFKPLAPWCDVVAMDVKLPSAIGREFWREHEEFLSLAKQRAFVKVVLTSDTQDDEMKRVVTLLAAAKPNPVLILQPVTPVAALPQRLAKTKGAKRMVQPPSPHQLADWLALARARLPDVRLLPQMHPLWGLR